MITSFSRGHEIYYNKDFWRYVDTNKPIDNKRPCKKCLKPPTKEGYDVCLGYIENAISACCGHGMEEKYIKTVNTPELKGKSNG